MKNLIAKARIGLVLLGTFALLSCASGPKQVFHSFEINGKYDGRPNAEGKYEGWGKDIDLLEYSYGDQYSMVRDSLEHPDTPSRHAGKTSLPVGPHGVAGPMPVGEFLYVKWRIKDTGEVFEDRVDLRDRLPRNMMHHTLTFVPDGVQLRVFVETPTPIPKTDVPNYKKTRTHLTAHSAYYKTYEIYPTLEPYPEQLERCLRGEYLCGVDKSKK